MTRFSWRALAATVAAIVALAASTSESAPIREDVEPWLGRYAAGPDTVTFRWDNETGLVYEHGRIAVPADGEWHETVPEFAVRHRVSWLPEKKVFLVEETHDRSEPWRHELRFDAEAQRLLKYSLSGGTDGGEILVRTYLKEKP